MRGTRKHLENISQKLGSLKLRHQDLKDTLIRLEGQASYTKTEQFYEKSLVKLNNEIMALPIGYRYTGVFYLKQPYTLPVEFEKIEGSIFMREDLMSWALKDPGDRMQIYYRSAFKAPDLDTEISLEEAIAEYAQPV